MNVEFSLTSANAKTRAIGRLRDCNLPATSGPTRLSYPFSITVDGITQSQLDLVTQLLRSVDPCAGRILTAADGS